MATIRRDADQLEVSLATEHVIGRMQSCNTCLPASFVSLAHALVRWTGRGWELRDLGSTNGTFLDGCRLSPGESSCLRTDAVVIFGDKLETWRMTSDAAPSPAAVPLEGGEPIPLVSGVIAFFEGDELAASIYLDQDIWYLEVDDARTALASGQHFRVREREWRFECPSVASSTFEAGTELFSIDDFVLEFHYSNDEEHVRLCFGSDNQSRVLRERSCLYLALVLARRRLEDERAGFAEHGWVGVDELLKMIPDYSSYAALNVEIYRLRRLFADAGARDSSRIIERRRGQLRIGAARLSLVRQNDPRALAAAPELL